MSVRPESYIPEPDPNVSFEGWLAARTKNWIKEFQSVFGHEGECGRNRHVFFTINYVYKVPLSMEGISDNYHEAKHQGGQFAECWVEHDADGIPILIMERVKLWTVLTKKFLTPSQGPDTRAEVAKATILTGRRGRPLNLHLFNSDAPLGLHHV